MSFDLHTSDYIKNKARIRTTHPNFQGEKVSFYQGFCDGGNAIIAAIQSGELPLKALALPIEELNDYKGACICWFSDETVEVYDTRKACLKTMSITHFLPLGGGDE